MPSTAARALRDRDEATNQPSRPELTLLVNRAPERRTVVITGQRPQPRRSPVVTQTAARPDRVAMWAFLLGLFLVCVALATG